MMFIVAAIYKHNVGQMYPERADFMGLEKSTHTISPKENLLTTSWQEPIYTYILFTGLYTDESPGLKVDPVVVLVLSLVFIFSVVALHSKFR